MSVIVVWQNMHFYQWFEISPESNYVICLTGYYWSLQCSNCSSAPRTHSVKHSEPLSYTERNLKTRKQQFANTRDFQYSFWPAGIQVGFQKWSEGCSGGGDSLGYPSLVVCVLLVLQPPLSHPSLLSAGIQFLKMDCCLPLPTSLHLPGLACSHQARKVMNYDVTYSTVLLVRCSDWDKWLLSPWRQKWASHSSFLRDHLCSLGPTIKKLREGRSTRNTATQTKGV